MNAWILYLLLLRATLTSFSGFGSVPLVREDLVARRAVLTDAELNSAIAISQASPGPLGEYIVIVGYFVGGLPGAIAGMLALATPALLALPILWVIRRGKSPFIRAGSSGIVIAASVLMLTTTVRLAPEAMPDLPLAIIAVVAFVALASGRVAPAVVVIGGAVVGLFIA